jgi:hypothetical protein
VSVPERSKAYPATPAPWGKTPREVTTDARLSVGARAVYAHLATHADADTGRIGAMSVRQIADEMHLPRSSIHDWLSELYELRHVLVVTPGGERRAAVLWLGWGCPQASGPPDADTRFSVRPTGRSVRPTGQKAVSASGPPDALLIQIGSDLKTERARAPIDEVRALVDAAAAETGWKPRRLRASVFDREHARRALIPGRHQ